MAQLLRDVGFECECLSDAAEIRAALDQGVVDVLVADIRMPGNFNLELVEHVRNSPSPPSVILMTGFPTLETAISSIKLRISAYLVKPFGFDELLREVEAALLDGNDSGDDLHQSGIIQVADSRSLSERHPELKRLTKREREVLDRVLTGGDVPAIGASLYISPHTVRNHLKAIYRKLDVRSRVELVVRFGSKRPGETATEG
jgi:DNA-binding NarL/FixJ family response regulator